MSLSRTGAYTRMAARYVPVAAYGKISELNSSQALRARRRMRPDRMLGAKVQIGVVQSGDARKSLWVCSS
jgi:hypothetical protein